jgi:hypothetical protein
MDLVYGGDQNDRYALLQDGNRGIADDLSNDDNNMIPLAFILHRPILSSPMGFLMKIKRTKQGEDGGMNIMSYVIIITTWKSSENPV